MVGATAWTAAAAMVLSLPALDVAPARAAPEPRTSADVCSVVPKKVLELGTGNPLRDGIASATSLGNGSCRFAALDDVDGVDVELTVSTHRRRDAARPGYAFGSLNAFERIYGDARRVRGVGKRAWFAYATEINRQAALLVIRHDTAVQVVLSGSVHGRAAGRKQAVAIAKVTLKALAGT